MIEDVIDFGNYNRKIIVNPIVPLQLLNLKCRNGNRIQGTILGKVHPSYIDVLQVIPVAVCDQNKIVSIDYAQHQRNIENILNVYSTLQIIGVAVTDLKPDISLATLHTIYVNKDSGFKSQGILNCPIILSVNTQFSNKNNNYQIEAYSYNQTFRFCKQIMDIAAFQKLNVRLSFGDSTYQSMTPLFQAFNDQQKVIPHCRSGQMMRVLAQKLKQLKIKCQKEQGQQLKVKLRQIISRVTAKQCINTEQLGYLLDLSTLQKSISYKMNKVL